MIHQQVKNEPISGNASNDFATTTSSHSNGKLEKNFIF